MEQSKTADKDPKKKSGNVRLHENWLLFSKAKTHSKIEKLEQQQQQQ
jgi:hypothetical protein